MKVCKECKKELPLDDFYKAKGMKDGHLNKCKGCISAGVRRNREYNIDYYREYDRKRGCRKTKQQQQEYREQNPKKYKATNAVNNAIRDGRMKKETVCSECDSTDSIHAHHDDYNYPLTVRWLCAACHKSWHDINGEGKV